MIRERAFTLVEVLVVVVIIALLVRGGGGEDHAGRGTPALFELTLVAI